MTARSRCCSRRTSPRTRRAAFGTTIPAATMAKLARPVLRPARRPGRITPRRARSSRAPRLLVGDLRLITNKTGAVIDYRVRAPQINGRGIYSSAGSCGLLGSATFSSELHDLGRRLHLRRPPRQHDRRALGAAGRRRELLTPRRRQRRSSARRARPRRAAAADGRREHRPGDGRPDDPRVQVIVKCAPDQATWPVNPATCTSFMPAGVKLDRSITQNGTVGSPR